MSASEVTASVTAYWEARAPYFNGTASHVCTPDCTSRGLPPPPAGVVRGLQVPRGDVCQRMLH